MNNEPVAYVSGLNQFSPVMANVILRIGTPLYTHPADLTDEEIWERYKNYPLTSDLRTDIVAFVRAILRKV